MNILKTVLLLGMITSLSFGCIEKTECKANFKTCKKQDKKEINKIFKCIEDAQTKKDLKKCKDSNKKEKIVMKKKKSN